METGKRNRRIQVQTLGTSELDAFQQPLPAAWTTVYSCWASIEIQNSALIYDTAAFMSKVVYRITILWTSSIVISAKQRIVYIEPTTQIVHTYEIEAVLNTKAANRELVLLAYELEVEE